MKTAVVTGASRGIGQKTAFLLAENGWQVVGGECRHSGTPQSGISYVQADLSKPQEAARFIQDATRILGHIDLLVNCAGISESRLFTDITDEEWDRMIATNLSSVFYTCRAALPGMIHRKTGKIINIASMWGETGASCEVHYSAAKAGVIGLTKALAKEVAPSGILVNALSPGAVDTDMMRVYSKEDIAALCDEIPLGRMGTAEEIARWILFLAESNSYATGQVFSINGGILI